MTGIVHFRLAEELKSSPDRVADLLRLAGVGLPDHASLELHDKEVTSNSRPETRVTERFADTVFLWRERHGSASIIRLASGIEVQTSLDWKKRFRWPEYLCSLRGNHRSAHGAVLVVCTKSWVARWARLTISLDSGVSRMAPFVLAPEQIPPIIEVEDEIKHPALAGLSLVGHPDSHDVLDAVIGAHHYLHATDEVAAAVYCEYLLSLLKDSPALSLLEEKMFKVEGWTPETEVGKAAWAEGKAEGEAKGSAAMLLVVVDGLGLVLTDDQRRRIATCGDLAVLDQWAKRAIAAKTADDLFE